MTDCALNPDLCVPWSQVMEPQSGLEENIQRNAELNTQYNAGRSDSSVLVAVVAILCVALVVGFILLGYMWKNDRNKKKRKLQQQAKPFNNNESMLLMAPKKSGPENIIGTGPVLMERHGLIPPVVAQEPITPTTPQVLIAANNVNDVAKQPEKPDITFQNEQDRYDDFDERRYRKKGGRTTQVQELTEANQEQERREKRKGGLKFKYRHMGGFDDLGSVHPAQNNKDESNQCLWDICMVRLSLINEDFLHKSRYISGQTFGFKHDVLVVNTDDGWEQEEVDSYESGGRAKQGSGF